MALFNKGVQQAPSKDIASAILSEDLQQVKLHLQSGIDVNAPLDSRGSRPIHYAVNSTPQILSLLIKHGANVNIRTSDGQAPILTAAATAKFEMVRILVDNGANVNVMDNESETALDHVRRGLPSDRLYASWGSPVDSYSSSSKQQERHKIVQFLLRHGAR